MNNRDERKVLDRRFLTAFAVSVFLHVLLIAVSLYLQYLTGFDRLQLKTIDVSLVTLPGPGSPSDADMTEGLPSVPEPVKEPQTSRQSPVPIEPAKPEAVKKVPAKTSEKPKQPKKSPVEDKLKKLEQQVQQKQPSDFERTLARLQQKVQEGPPSDLYKRSGPGSFGLGDGEYGAPVSPYESYLAEVVMIIRQNWSFIPQLIGEKGDIKAYVSMTIQPGGAISDITFDRKSVSEYFNDTAFKAIEKSSPLPPIPEEVGDSALRIGLVFTPQGIE